MEMKWLSWNVRSLGTTEKRRAVKDLIKKTRLELVLLLETKLDAQKEKIAQNFAKSLNFDFELVPAEGVAGGIMTMWKPSVFTQQQVLKGNMFLLILFRINQMISIMLWGIFTGHMWRAIELTSFMSWELLSTLEIAVVCWGRF